MRAPFNTLFGRLFGVLLVAIILAHVLAIAWFRHYGPPPPPPQETFVEQPDGTMKPLIKEHHRPWFGGPVVPLTFQFISLIIAAWYGAKLLSRPIQRLSDAAERLSLDLDSSPLEETGPREARQAAYTFNLMQRRIREQVSQRARMLGAVSHDLRTPLSRLKLRLEQIEDTKLQGQMRQDLNDMIGMLDATLSYLHEQRTSETRHLLDVQALVESSMPIMSSRSWRIWPCSLVSSICSRRSLRRDSGVRRSWETAPSMRARWLTCSRMRFCIRLKVDAACRASCGPDSSSGGLSRSRLKRSAASLRR